MQTYHVCIWFSIISFFIYSSNKYIRYSSPHSDRSSSYSFSLFSPSPSRSFTRLIVSLLFFTRNLKSFIYSMISEWDLVWQFKLIETLRRARLRLPKPDTVYLTWTSYVPIFNSKELLDSIWPHSVIINRYVLRKK